MCYSVCWRLWRVGLFAGGAGVAGRAGGDAGCATLFDGGAEVLDAP